jgi:hypothetical protein
MALNRFLASETGSVKVEVINPLLNVSDAVTQTILTGMDATLTDMNGKVGYGHEVPVRAGQVPGGTISLTGHVVGMDLNDVRTIATGLIESERVTFDATRSGVNMRISSASALDAQAGTGTNRLSVTYIDGNEDEQKELVWLNGTAAANWGAVDGPTVREGIAINSFTAIINGSLGTGAGVIYGGPDSADWTGLDYRVAGQPDVIYAVIAPGPNISRMASCYTGNGVTVYPCNLFVTTTAGAGQDVEITTEFNFKTGSGANLNVENVHHYIGEGAHLIPLDCARVMSTSVFFEIVTRNHNGVNIDVSCQLGALEVPTA